MSYYRYYLKDSSMGLYSNMWCHQILGILFSKTNDISQFQGLSLCCFSILQNITHYFQSHVKLQSIFLSSVWQLVCSRLSNDNQINKVRKVQLTQYRWAQKSDVHVGHMFYRLSLGTWHASLLKCLCFILPSWFSLTSFLSTEMSRVHC